MKRAFSIIILLIMTAATPALAGDVAVPDIDMVRTILVQPDFDYSIFIGEELCTALIYIIENDQTEIRDKLILKSLCALPETEDERAVKYLAEYIDEYPLDCLYGLGDFSTTDSCKALMAHLADDDELSRRYATQSLGKLDYTITDEMWTLRGEALAKLANRIEAETEEWLIPFLETAYENITIQVRDVAEEI